MNASSYLIICTKIGIIFRTTKENKTYCQYGMIHVKYCTFYNYSCMYQKKVVPLQPDNNY